MALVLTQGPCGKSSLGEAMQSEVPLVQSQSMDRVRQPFGETRRRNKDFLRILRGIVRTCLEDEDCRI